jgi:hypothetical protein
LIKKPVADAAGFYAEEELGILMNFQWDFNRAVIIIDF